jgi:hypothetical protein
VLLKRVLATVVLCVSSMFVVAGCAPMGTLRGYPGAEKTTPSPGPRSNLVPERGAYLGVYYGDRPSKETDASLGRSPQIHLTYFGWKDEWAISDIVRQDAAAGQISLVNWEPFDVDFADIVDGQNDEMLVTRAKQAGELTHPVFLDFAAEMNEEEGWGGHDAALYVATFRHIHDIFELYDNGNTVWVWAPNNVDSEEAPGALEYYPGDEYVDWTGIDGYNWGTSQPGFEWQNFDEVFRPMYTTLSALRKPIIVGETSSAEEGGNKGEWIADIIPTLRDDFPLIRAVVWFDVDKERDWRIASSSDSMSAFRALATDPYFGSSAPW